MDSGFFRFRCALLECAYQTAQTTRSELKVIIGISKTQFPFKGFAWLNFKSFHSQNNGLSLFLAPKCEETGSYRYFIKRLCRASSRRDFRERACWRMPFPLSHVDGISVYPVLKPPRNSTLKTAVAAITSQRDKLVAWRTNYTYSRTPRFVRLFFLLGLFHSNENLKLWESRLHESSKVKRTNGKLPVFDVACRW